MTSESVISRRYRRAATALCGLAALVALAGCGSTASKSAPASTALRAPTSASDAGVLSSVPNGHYPVTIRDCGVSTTYTHAPTRAVTIEESSTEFMLALGLQGHMVGTAYIDSPVLPRFVAAYRTIPVLGNASVSEEVVLAHHPDFVYGAYADQFAAADGSGTRASLQKAGVDTFLSPSDCISSANHPVGWDDIWREITDVGEIFGVENRANALVRSQQKELTALTAHGLPFKGLKVFWYDSDTTPPYVGAGYGVPALLMRTLGATNIFASAPGGWANGNWETVVAADPNVIVFDNAVWDTTRYKERFLASYAATRELPAVTQRDYLPIDFADITPSVRNVSALAILTRELEGLHLHR